MSRVMTAPPLRSGLKNGLGESLTLQSKMGYIGVRVVSEEEYKWWIQGSKTTCANCGEAYIQDINQSFLNDPNEWHPDIRILCPKCRPYSSAFDSLKDPKTENEVMLSLYIDNLEETIKNLKIDLYMNKFLLGNKKSQEEEK